MRYGGTTHNLAVKVVFLDHHNVDSLGILEGKESEATRATGGAISHNGAFYNLAVLREVISE